MPKGLSDRLDSKCEEGKFSFETTARSVAMRRSMELSELSELSSSKNTAGASLMAKRLMLERKTKEALGARMVRWEVCRVPLREQIAWS
ncbi:uncharacterized protein MONOS_4879 [Monocercomonoides exilis]|uniref:uncharacterized protein n=1 Tax=Monocercomonoides exilis TaxID=2049356 RepID=UPI003559D234|nr:hypothetical protein MONOS_4879 [Monocercomonoides exilis]|eukprot:MONOS_4879.1-p1 / transcript=MONOS_4879.1 / gene=MONOS_4879 / organism=Monocercomonoides_exilis_PA203 / gene_product=unspecified product / transcript_product=unspecified product / location=Mono_scaffold00136:47286-47552(-) / protein_length=89 / sequence_SO=supercontig / SO=protein_coding / is_pseudo=false